MNVLSLFDGMSCGQIALNRIGLKPTKYFASEVDKHAIKVTKENYPETIQLGDVRNIDVSNLPKIDILIGGSPCQSFSFAGKREGMATTENIEILSLQQYEEMKAANFEFKGQSYLFWEYVRILKEVKPKYFFLENVRMSAKWRNLISEVLGVQPVLLNSALVSAQSRKRLYWFNIPGYKAPKDKGLVLKDIINCVNNCFIINKEKIISELSNYTKRNFEISVFKNKNFRPHQNDKRKSGLSEISTVCFIDNKSTSLIASHVPFYYYCFDSTMFIKKFSVNHCERLQTVPDNYTASVSNSQRFKMLGNGWTVDAVAHIFQGLKLDRKPKKFFKTTLF